MLCFVSVFFWGDEQSVKGEKYGVMMDGQEMEKAFKDHDMWYFISLSVQYPLSPAAGSRHSSNDVQIVLLRRQVQLTHALK